MRGHRRGIAGKKTLDPERVLTFRIAQAIGLPAAEVEERVGTDEASDWALFFREEEERFCKQDAYLAQLAMVVDAKLSSRPRRRRLEDYRIKYQSRRPAEDLGAALKAFLGVGDV